MARGHDNGTTILLGLNDYKVGEVLGGEEKVVVKTEVKGRIKCPYCGSGKLMGTARASQGSPPHLEHWQKGLS